VIAFHNSDVVRRRDELTTRVAQLTRAADQIRAVYDALLGDLQREARSLAPLRVNTLPGLASFSGGAAASVSSVSCSPDSAG
jgi:hypothetical protein